MLNVDCGQATDPLPRAGYSRKQILIADSSEVSGKEIAVHHQHYENHEIHRCFSGNDVLQLLRQQHFDLVLLEISLTDIDGPALCKLIRRQDKTVAIIVRALDSSESDEVLSLDMGANDFIVESAPSTILLARIRAQLRQHEHRDDAEFTIGTYIFRPGTKTLVDSAAGKKIRLTVKESTILRLLYRNRGNVVEHETLLQQIWGYEPGIDTHTLQTHIYRLRQKIEQNPSDPTLVVNVPCGYMLTPHSGKLPTNALTESMAL